MLLNTPFDVAAVVVVFVVDTDVAVGFVNVMLSKNDRVEKVSTNILNFIVQPFLLSEETKGLS